MTPESATENPETDQHDCSQHAEGSVKKALCELKSFWREYAVAAGLASCDGYGDFAKKVKDALKRGDDVLRLLIHPQDLEVLEASPGFTPEVCKNLESYVLGLVPSDNKKPILPASDARPILPAPYYGNMGNPRVVAVANNPGYETPTDISGFDAQQELQFKRLMGEAVEPPWVTEQQSDPTNGGWYSKYIWPITLNPGAQYLVPIAAGYDVALAGDVLFYADFIPYASKGSSDRFVRAINKIIGLDGAASHYAPLPSQQALIKLLAAHVRGDDDTEPVIVFRKPENLQLATEFVGDKGPCAPEVFGKRTTHVTNKQNFWLTVGNIANRDLPALKRLLSAE